MAMLRYGSATVIEPVVNNGNTWVNQVYKSACADGKCRIKTSSLIVAQYRPEKYLLTHCSIVAAVDVDEAAESKSTYKDYLVKPEYSKFVNNNGDAWTKAMLYSCYKTFIGCNNYLEHVQKEELSKGKVIDAVLREVVFGKDVSGKDLSTYYVDILVATDRSHEDLVRKIEAGDLKTLSMGCKILFSVCSKCGNKAVDETETCNHVKFEKNNTFYDGNGVPRKVAELCGHVSDPKSVTFVDASWVAIPAFTGAVVRSVLEPPQGIKEKIEVAHIMDSYRIKSDDFLKTAKDNNEMSPAEVGDTDKSPVISDPAIPDPGMEELKGAPFDKVENEGIEEDSGSELKEWKKKIKNKILEEIGDDIIRDMEGLNEKDRPNELETLDDTMFRPASVFRKVWGTKKCWDKFIHKYAGNLSKKDFNKLRYGAYMIVTSSELGVLSNFGYNKRDFLAVMSFLDNHLGKPLDISIKRAMAKLGGTGNKCRGQVVEEISRIAKVKLTKEQEEKIITWLKALNEYSE